MNVLRTVTQPKYFTKAILSELWLLEKEAGGLQSRWEVVHVTLRYLGMRVRMRDDGGSQNECVGARELGKDKIQIVMLYF